MINNSRLAEFMYKIKVKKNIANLSEINHILNTKDSSLIVVIWRHLFLLVQKFVCILKFSISIPAIVNNDTVHPAGRNTFGHINPEVMAIKWIKK